MTPTWGELARRAAFVAYGWYRHSEIRKWWRRRVTTRHLRPKRARFESLSLDGPRIGVGGNLAMMQQLHRMRVQLELRDGSPIEVRSDYSNAPIGILHGLIGNSVPMWSQLSDDLTARGLQNSSYARDAYLQEQNRYRQQLCAKHDAEEEAWYQKQSADLRAEQEAKNAFPDSWLNDWPT